MDFDLLLKTSNLSNKCSQKRDSAKKSTSDAITTTSKGGIQETAEAISD